jgi:hypothetical protein
MATFGQTVAGGTTRFLDGNARGHTLTAPATLTAGSYSVWGYVEAGAVGAPFAAIIVSTSDNSTVLSQSAVRTDISTAGWYEFSGGDFDTFEPQNATSYHWLVACDSGTTPVIYYGTPGLTSGRSGGLGSWGPITLASTANADAGRDYAVYVEYTPSGGGSPLLLGQACL